MGRIGKDTATDNHVARRVQLEQKHFARLECTEVCGLGGGISGGGGGEEEREQQHSDQGEEGRGGDTSKAGDQGDGTGAND